MLPSADEDHVICLKSSTTQLLNGVWRLFSQMCMCLTSCCSTTFLEGGEKKNRLVFQLFVWIIRLSDFDPSPLRFSLRVMVCSEGLTVCFASNSESSEISQFLSFLRIYYHHCIVATCWQLIVCVFVSVSVCGGFPLACLMSEDSSINSS